MTRRTIGNNAVGKHIGHACEGHLRAAIKKFADQNTLILSRSFEILGQVVKPDAVLTNKDGKIAAVIICAYWDHSGSSEKKYYRTRIEYTVTHNLRNAHPELFVDDFKIITFFYGSDSGWKSVILHDIALNCRPFVFLPNMQTRIPWQQIVDSAYSVYKGFFEAGSSKSRQDTEEYFLAHHDHSITEVFEIISKIITDNSQSAVRIGENARAPSLPEKGYSTRLRQPLSLLSLVKDSAILEWHSNGCPVDENIEFCRKMFFFDMVNVFVKKRVNRITGVVWAQPRLASDNNGRYAPGKPDFYLWCKHQRQQIVDLLDKHRAMPVIHKSMKGAGQYQTYGNLACISKILKNVETSIQLYNFESLENLWALISKHNIPVTCEEWHPCSAKSFISYPLRDIFASAVATLIGDRSIRGLMGMGNTDQDPDFSEKILNIRPDAVRDELIQASKFITHIMSESFVDPDVEIPTRPAVLSLDRPESYIAGVYNLLTTHPTHNPLGNLLVEKISTMFPNISWYGWPTRRSVPLSEIIPKVTCRREWQIWGRCQDKIIFGEIKTVTDNNWGNKSKELYDRILDTREACRNNGIKCICVCLFDGDIFEEAYNELLSGIGYDIVIGIDTPLPVNTNEH